MKNQSPASEIVNNQTRCNNSRCCGAVRINNQAAQVSTMPLAVRTFVRSCLIRIPMTTGLESGDTDSFGIHGRFATAVAVEVEAVLPTGEPLQLRADDKALITVGCRNKPNRFTNAISVDAAQHNID